MSVTAQPSVAAPAHRAGWGIAAVALGLGLVILGLLFQTEIAAALHTWQTSTAYNHCPLVLPMAVWLAWVRRHRLASLTPRPSPLLALLALLPALAWLVAERLGIMEGRQLALIGFVWSLAAAVLGWRVWLAMAVPLGYLIFLVPFGEFAVPLLQSVTARMIELGLGVLGIPNHVDSLVIETPAGTFLVAEACAGLRFLIATLAFGALYAVTLFRSPGRRLLVMLLALAVPVLANGVRALGIVVLAEHLGSAEAAAADHVIYGWGFFSVILLLLIAAGLPFREDDAPPRAPISDKARSPRTGLALLAAFVAAALSGVGPAIAMALDRTGAGAPREVAPRLLAPAECQQQGPGLRCPGATVTARLLVFPPRVTWAAVTMERRRMAGADDEAMTFRVAPSDGTADWQARQERGRTGVVAVAAWLGGRPAGDGLRSRGVQARNSLVGGAGAPVLVAVEVRPDASAVDTINQAQQRDLLRAVLNAQGPGLVTQAAGLSIFR